MSGLNYNLNVPVAAAASPVQVAALIAQNRASARFDVVALAAEHKGAALGATALAALTGMSAAMQCDAATESGACGVRRVCVEAPRRVLRRLSVELSDTRQLHEMAQMTELLSQFDLVAVRPTDEKTLRAACCDADGVDLIALDLSLRLPLSFKFATVAVAIARDLFFEIDVAPLFVADAHVRASLLGNAVALIRVARGRNIVLSCSATTTAGMRTAPDIANLARVLGLDDAQARACNTRTAALCVRRGRFRAATRSFGVVEIRERTAADDAAFGIGGDDDDDDDDDDEDDDDDGGIQFTW